MGIHPEVALIAPAAVDFVHQVQVVGDYLDPCADAGPGCSASPVTGNSAIQWFRPGLSLRRSVGPRLELRMTMSMSPSLSRSSNAGAAAAELHCHPVSSTIRESSAELPLAIILEPGGSGPPLVTGGVIPKIHVILGMSAGHEKVPIAVIVKIRPAPCPTRRGCTFPRRHR